MARQFPAVLVTGARQAGKTSILRHLYPHASNLTLDLPSNAEAAQTAPEQLLERYPEPAIIDEIQYHKGEHTHYLLALSQRPGSRSGHGVGWGNGHSRRAARKSLTG